MVASDGGLSEGYGHEGPGVCQTEAFLKDTGMAGLGDGQMEAEGVSSQVGRGDAVLRCMSPYLTLETKGVASRLAIPIEGWTLTEH